MRPRVSIFYVGGVNKRLNGNSSADISGANWICSVDYNTQAGADGIGDKTTGFLHNYNSNGNKNIADGIAVSRVRRSTKRVSRATRSLRRPPLPRTSTTRPVTATGFPTTIFTARRTSCRASVSPSSGREPIRSSFPTGGNDAGEFVFFGGSFTQGGYYRGRSAVCRKLAADASGSLADIESGDGVTTYL